MILKLLIFVLVPVICIIILQQTVSAQVIINEVLPDPAAASDASEWVELYNAGSSEVSLTGWKLDSKTISDTAANIAANGFVIFTKSLTAFKTEFGDFPSVYEIGIGLTNSGDSISLVEPNGVMDTFSYTSSSANHSWERTGPLCTEIVQNTIGNTLLMVNKSAKSECFSISNEPTPSETTPIASIKFSIDNQNWVDTLENIGTTNLYFKADLNDDPTNYLFSWSLADDTVISSPVNLDNYLNQSIKLHLSRADSEWDFVSQPINIIPHLVISEVMLNSHGDSWLEIYNPNNFAVGGQFQLNINGNILPTSVMLDINDYQLVNLNQAQCIQDCHLLLKFGETVLTELSFDEMLADQSWSVDSLGNWHNDWSISPGIINSSRPPVVYDNSIQISEVYPTPDTSKGEQEWFELYNFSDSEIDLTGWYISDTAKSFILDGEIASKGYLVFMKPGISLNNGGDQISLFNPGQILVDNFSYPNTLTGISQMRRFQDTKYDTQILPTTKPTPLGMNDLVEKQSSSSSSSAKAVIIKTPASSSTSSRPEVLGSSSLNSTTSYKLPNLSSDSSSFPLQLVTEQQIDLLPWGILMLASFVYFANQIWINRQEIKGRVGNLITRVSQFRLDLVPD